MTKTVLGMIRLLLTCKRCQSHRALSDCPSSPFLVTVCCGCQRTEWYRRWYRRVPPISQCSIHMASVTCVHVVLVHDLVNPVRCHAVSGCTCKCCCTIETGVHTHPPAISCGVEHELNHLPAICDLLSVACLPGYY